jgi:hypothetical protein
VRRTRELARKVEDIADSGGSERVDRLRVVADDRDPLPVRLHRAKDRGLQAIGVLVFVDQDVIEACADLGGDRGFRHHLRPVQQQVVVVEDVLRLLGLHVRGEQLRELGMPLRTPWENASPSTRSSGARC